MKNLFPSTDLLKLDLPKDTAFLFNQWKIPNIIKKEARKKKQVIYGSRAMNVQLPLFFQRPTVDYDIFTSRPKQTAHKMQKLLDKKIAGGRDEFYSEPAIHPGTHRVIHRGADMKQGTDDDVHLIDFTEMPDEIPTTVIEGLEYEKLSSIKKRKKEILKDPESKYRHEKDRGDLERIDYSRIFRGGL